jgi:hypothetical protein
MVKLFFVVAGVVTLALIGVFTMIFGPLIAGAKGNLGGNPTAPFHSPFPQPVADLFASAAAQTTPSVLLTGLLAIVGLLAVYTMGTLVAHLVRRWKRHRQKWAELRWRGRVSAALRKTTPSSARSKAEFESMWK